jgi:aclacinomycin oxidase
VTRFWFRSADASSNDPATILPRAPSSITTFKVEWNWADLDERSFLRLLTNHGEWCEQNSDLGSVNCSLWTLLEIHRKQFGTIVVRGVSTDGDGVERQMRAHLEALSDGGVAPSAPEVERLSWLEFALDPLPELFTTPPGGVSVKVKDALLKKRFTDRQIGIAYDYMTRDDYDVIGGVLGMATYGGRVNVIAPDATAAAQRSAILDTACNTGWIDPADAERNLAWVRRFYRDLFADTGGVPVPGASYDGALINHPDTDLTNPALNTSEVPWSSIYYQGNYVRLQEVKRRWDPRDVFRHALSVRPS